MNRFILLFLIFPFLVFALQKNNFPKDCKKAHKGNFYFIPENTNFKVIIENFGKEQISHRLYQKFFKKELKTWPSSCVYTVEMTEIHDPYLGKQLGKVSTFQITKITEESYEFVNVHSKETGRVFFVQDLQAIIEEQKLNPKNYSN